MKPIKLEPQINSAKPNGRSMGQTNAVKTPLPYHTGPLNRSVFPQIFQDECPAIIRDTARPCNQS